LSTQVSIRNLTAVYAAPGGGTLLALGPVTFGIEPGEFVCLVGPSGCGKSTLLRIIAGLQPPTKGSVSLNDQPVTEPSRQVAIMFQEANLMPWRTVLDNVALPLELAGVNRTERYRTTQALLSRLGLEDFAPAYPGELSGGMAQRVALGRILIQHPDLLLLDEPFGALDALTREQVSADLMKMWMQEKQTVLMVTHDINEAVWLADRVIVLSRRPGQIIADNPVSLPRPRTLGMTYSEEFGEVAQSVRASIERA
jgi:NitT/TauT family transport system ATP-binding protein